MDNQSIQKVLRERARLRKRASWKSLVRMLLQCSTPLVIAWIAIASIIWPDGQFMWLGIAVGLMFSIPIGTALSMLQYISDDLLVIRVAAAPDLAIEETFQETKQRVRRSMNEPPIPAPPDDETGLKS